MVQVIALAAPDAVTSRLASVELLDPMLMLTGFSLLTVLFVVLFGAATRGGERITERVPVTKESVR